MSQPPSSIDQAAAQEACAALSLAYPRHADAGEAEALANLFAADGVFDRLGQRFIGRTAIRNLIASRPPGVWTRHVCSNLRLEIAPDGRSAQGSVDLEMQRGRDGAAEVEQLRAVYADHYVLTGDGWRFGLRRVVLAP